MYKILDLKRVFSTFQETVRNLLNEYHDEEIPLFTLCFFCNSEQSEHVMTKNILTISNCLSIQLSRINSRTYWKYLLTPTQIKVKTLLIKKTIPKLLAFDWQKKLGHWLTSMAKDGNCRWISKGIILFEWNRFIKWKDIVIWCMSPAGKNCLNKNIFFKNTTFCSYIC